MKSMVAAIAIILIGVGCTPPPEGNRTDQVSTFAATWMRSVSGGTEDRGWSLLHPNAQDASYRGVMQAYVTEAEAAPWDFPWKVDHVRFSDGQYFVVLDVDDPRATLPSFLINRGLVQIYDDANGFDIAELGVLVTDGKPLLLSLPL